ncbi:MAG: L-histidine N(alpha)-methyltransferase [Myxococcota bacterium]
MTVALAAHCTGSPLARAVWEGLARRPKRLPPWLFYDEVGSALYERITELDEYYPTRTERLIFELHADAIVHAAAGFGDHPTVIELGAGTATKTELLLAAWRRRGAEPLFVPVDVSPTPLAIAAERLGRTLPGLAVRPLVATHDEAFASVATLPSPRVVLFIGSSIGNYEDADARDFLRGVRTAVGSGGRLVLGTDLAKSPDVLVPAYDDAQGVTAAFNLNLLERINRELGGHFERERFRHVALWNAAASQIEMHLESLVTQRVAIEGLDTSFVFERGERIHTESSVKYDVGRVDRLLAAAGFVRERTFHDPRQWFAVHVAVVR